MLHILLLILKIIGLIIAVILGILVLLVCVVLFVPVRYDLEAVSTGTVTRTRVKARVTWLLHLFRADVCFEEKQLSWQIRVAWKKIQSGQERKKTIEAEVETYEKELEDDREGSEEESGKGPGDSGVDSQETGKKPPVVRNEEKGRPFEELREKQGGSLKRREEERESLMEKREEERESLMEKREEEQGGSVERLTQIWEEPGRNVEKVPKEPERLVDELEREMEKILETGKNPEILEDPETADLEEGEEPCEEHREGRKEREADSQGSEEERTGIWQKITGFCQNIYQKIADLYRRIAEIPGKIKSVAGGMADKIRGLSEKKDKILYFLSDEIHQTAFIKARDELFFLLRRLKPKEIQADIQYGFEDPSLTGKVLAGLSMCYPFLGDGVDIRPDFEKKIFDGHLRITGRLRVSYFVKLLWKLILSREVRMTYRHVRKFEL